MSVYRIQAEVSRERDHSIKGPSALAGGRLDVVINDEDRERPVSTRYPLHGKVVVCRDPFASVAEDESRYPRVGLVIHGSQSGSGSRRSPPLPRRQKDHCSGDRS